MKGKIKTLISKLNPAAVLRRRAMRKRLTNTTPSFLCPNCIGGILFYDLGLQFRSPTVNTMMYQRDFVKFVLHLDDYLKQELVFFRHPVHTCPCAKLGDLTIHFTHYRTEEEAARKWAERAGRIDRENLFVFLIERDGLTKQEILSLQQLNVRGLLVFTAHDYPDVPYALQLKEYEADGMVGNILIKNRITERRAYEKHFDFVKWFNDADSASYDVSKFVL